MKIEELLSELAKFNPEAHIVVVCEHDHAFTHEILSVNQGYDTEGAGAIRITVNQSR